MSTIGCTRREFLTIVGLGTASLSMSTAFCTNKNYNRPNIILIMIDNVGYGDFGINGNRNVRTPNLDAFAREGIQFSRFYCNPLCAPTRADLMTGRYYYRTGVIHTSRGGALMHGDEITVAEFLKKAGYTTGMFGKWHLGDNYPMRPQDQGFDNTLWHKSARIGQVPDFPNTYFNPTLWQNGKKIKTNGYCTDVFYNAAIKFIEENRNKSFFIYLPTNVGHTAQESIVGQLVAPKYFEPYKKIGISDTTAKVYGMITNFDENFGGLIAKLEQLNLRENTLIIFTSDDGPGQEYNAGLRGGTIYEARIRVPLFVQWGKHFQKGRTINRIATHVDIIPTLLDLCGMTIPEEPVIDGTSLLPLLKDIDKEWPDRKIFLQCHRGLQPKRYQNCAVITQRYKMIGYPETFNDENLKTSIENPKLELYDLIDDPGEKNNIADNNPEILRDLCKAYDNWFDDMKNTRNFTPGYIYIGSDKENPVHLCRYQDSAYINGKPTGWLVTIEKSGEYEFTINRGESTAAGEMCIKINDKVMSKPIGEGKNRAVFHLIASKTKLDVWVEEEGKPYTPRSIEDTIGDVDVRKL